MLPRSVTNMLPDGKIKQIAEGRFLEAASGTSIASLASLGVSAVGFKAMFSGNSADLLVNPASTVANHAMNAGTGALTKTAGLAADGARGLGGLAKKGANKAWHFIADSDDHHGAPTSGVPPVGGTGGRKLH